MADTDSLAFRVYSSAAGHVYLYDEQQHLEVEVETPVTRETLEFACRRLIDSGQTQSRRERLAHEGKNEASATAQQLANRQIKAVVQPELQSRQPVARLISVVQYATVCIVLLLVLYMSLITFPRFHEEVSEGMRLAIVLANAVGLGFFIYFFAAEEHHGPRLQWIKKHYGPYVLARSSASFLGYPCMTLIGAAAVFASLTFTLFQHQMVAFGPCRDQPTVSVEYISLFEFYMWHFFKLVPFLKLNETLNWVVPFCYTQKHVGLLILLFQALVVLPIIKALRFYWKNRHSTGATPYKFLYEPGWRPVITNEYRTKQNHLFDDRRQ